jgi:hypothetical protein
MVILVAFTSTSKERYRLSFFDEVDEPPRTESRTAPRTSSRTAPRRRRPSGTGGRRPPGDQQAVQVRRAVAAVALVIVILLVALGVHSCQVSAANSALKDYANNVSSLITRSDNTGSQLFHELSGGAGSSNPTSVQTSINATLSTAQTILRDAQAMSVPDAVRAANQNLLLALQMRRDGLTRIAGEIQPALGTTASKDAITAIAAQMAVFYASDVLYKDYTAPGIVSALHAAAIPVGGTNGVTINGGQFVPDLQWLTPSYVATELHVTAPGLAPAKIAPGLHGHKLNSVSVAGTTLQTGSTNTIPSKPAPTFTLNFTNGGANPETNVVCKVTVTGTGISGQKIVARTTAGETTTCAVTLASAPPAGTQTVVATIAPVPGEKTLSNNSLSFPVTFQ